MPVYTFKCGGCETQFDRTLRVTQRTEPQGCPECSTVAKQVVGNIGFVLKGDAWPGKAIKIRGQMRDRQKAASSRQRDRKFDGGGMSLTPNVDGQRVDSWEEAKKLASSKGKNTSAYDSQIRRRKARSDGKA